MGDLWENDGHTPPNFEKNETNIQVFAAIYVGFSRDRWFNQVFVGWMGILQTYWVGFIMICPSNMGLNMGSDQLRI